MAPFNSSMFFLKLASRSTFFLKLEFTELYLFGPTKIERSYLALNLTSTAAIHCELSSRYKNGGAAEPAVTNNFKIRILSPPPLLELPLRSPLPPSPHLAFLPARNHHSIPPEAAESLTT